MNRKLPLALLQINSSLLLFIFSCNYDIGLKLEYNDNGKGIDSLQAYYKAEKIEYENWENDDKTDSTLTVCFINSKKLPANDIDSEVNEFVAIASRLYRSIKEKKKYNSYYIIFVTRETQNFVTSSSHTAGMNVSVQQFESNPFQGR